MTQATTWRCGVRVLTFEVGRPLVMGIVNVTPDSFYLESRMPELHEALDHALALLEEGADILDIGGESTRPGSVGLRVEEELTRVIPVIEGVRRAAPEALISVDTTKTEIAVAAMDAGAAIINDISAGRHDPGMADLCARTGAGVILMHMQGSPRDMQENPQYDNVLREVHDFLLERRRAFIAAGCRAESLAFDPGIGFGKTVAHNLALLAGIRHLCPMGPIVIGASRKRFIGAITQVENPRDRLPGSLSAALWAAREGAAILRVHDVAATRQALAIQSAIQAAEEGRP